VTPYTTRLESAF